METEDGAMRERAHTNPNSVKASLWHLFKNNAMKVLLLLATIGASTLSAYLINNQQIQLLKSQLDNAQLQIQLLQTQLAAAQGTEVGLNANLLQMNNTLRQLNVAQLIQSANALNGQLQASTASFTSASGLVKNEILLMNKIVQALAAPKVRAYYSCTKPYTVVGPVYMDFNTKELDTHNAVVGAGNGVQTASGLTWRFIVPVAGDYSITAFLSLQGTAPSPTDNVWIYVMVNGSYAKFIGYYYMSTAASPIRTGGHCDLQLKAGDVVEIITQQGSTTQMQVDYPGSGSGAAFGNPFVTISQL